MGWDADKTYEAVDLAEAVRLLASEAGLDAGADTAAEIAKAVGCESAALRWAGALARTTGWRPLLRRLASWDQLPVPHEAVAAFDARRPMLSVADVALAHALAVRVTMPRGRAQDAEAR